MNRALLSPWTKLAAFLICTLPAANLFWRAWHQDLGANPIEFVTHATGDWSLRLILITLAVTPMRKALNLPLLARFRRMLGLFAFFYGCLHFRHISGSISFLMCMKSWATSQSGRLLPSASPACC